ncbi:MAG: DNA repair protein RecN [Eubacterium aggregans]|uniref:DNA repair protein RecN n=1 Tax=Eubacterium aggregans TaxID=81409 RepID=UPI0023F433DD|nr:DNA repair protein RecN [Eubacterium aggregans]MDD4690651.1 DNA repair protein RecN [Eubacterium aggregans]MEA5073425.1 DNA repair protein RecN [Eubacterium aggregans]
MLQRINIKNYALIENLDIEFDDGLNVITGETGAGKSIIIDAITLLLGQRGNRDNIRKGAKKMVVQGVFDVLGNDPMLKHLEELEIEIENGELLLSRSIDERGKNICRANGVLVTVTQLKTIGENLIDIHSQHEHNSLFRTESHRILLDTFGGQPIAQLLEKTTQMAGELKILRTNILETERDQREIERQKENYQFELKEISEAHLEPGEDEYLTQEKNILENSEKLFTNANEAYQILNGGEELDTTTILSELSRMGEYLAVLGTIDPIFKSFEKTVEEAYSDLENLSGELYTYIDHIDFDMDTLDEVEKRLIVIAGLKRKYGETVDEIITYGAEVARALSQITNQDEYKDQLKQQYLEVWDAYKIVAMELNTKRHDIAEQLAEIMVQELKDLAMEKAVIKVDIQQDDKRISPTGQDHVEFLISVNPGIAPKPIRKVASGGEISRIMLALKGVFGGMDTIITMIFDEIDTGISGRTAQAVAEKILKLSRNRQIICITHLPQIAAMADRHFRVEKDLDENSVEVHFEELTDAERTEELARMLSGAEITQTTYDHAKEMLEMTKNLKHS